MLLIIIHRQRKQIIAPGNPHSKSLDLMEGTCLQCTYVGHITALIDSYNQRTSHELCTKPNIDYE